LLSILLHQQRLLLLSFRTLDIIIATLTRNVFFLHSHTRKRTDSEVAEKYSQRQLRCLKRNSSKCDKSFSFLLSISLGNFIFLSSSYSSSLSSGLDSRPVRMGRRERSSTLVAAATVASKQQKHIRKMETRKINQQQKRSFPGKAKRNQSTTLFRSLSFCPHLYVWLCIDAHISDTKLEIRKSITLDDFSGLIVDRFFQSLSFFYSTKEVRHFSWVTSTPWEGQRGRDE